MCESLGADARRASPRRARWSRRSRRLVRVAVTLLAALTAVRCDRSATDTTPSALALLRQGRWRYEEFCDCSGAFRGSYCQGHPGNQFDDSALLRADIDSFVIIQGAPGTSFEGRYFARRARGRLTTTYYRHNGITGRSSVDTQVDTSSGAPYLVAAGSDTVLISGDLRVRLIRDIGMPLRFVLAPGARSSSCVDRPDRPPVLERR